MSNKTKILTKLSKIVEETMTTFSVFKREIETVVRLRVEKAISKMNLVKRDEFEALKKVVQKLASKNKVFKNKSKKVGLVSNKKKKRKI